MTHRYAVVFDQGPDSVGAHVPDLPGCIAAGRDFQDAERLIREAIEAHIETLRSEGLPVPPPSTRCEYVETAPSTSAGD